MSGEKDTRETAHWAVHEIALTPEATAALCSLAGSLGFDAVRIDLATCGDKTSFLDRMAESLAFPAWFGQNWDAFFDCLADLGWRPARGYVLLLEHADTMRCDAPEALDTALAILGDAASAWESRGVPFRVFVSAPERTDAG
jgi:RNAse (barnase) inhibitor barstar